MTAGFGRAATMSLSQNRVGLSGSASLYGLGEETDAGSGQKLGERGVKPRFQSGGTCGSSAKASISLCGGWVIYQK
jgi:hypothetical protein